MRSRSPRAAPGSSPALSSWFRRISAPFTVALTWLSNGVARLFGVRQDALDEEQPTSEDLQVLISQSATRGKLDPGEATMLGGVFHLHEQEAREIMTPIPAVVTVDYSANVSDALDLCTSSGHNRLVVVEDGNQDRVRGHRPRPAPRAADDGRGPRGPDRAAPSATP